MALLKALCWALIFIIRIRFPPATSLAMILIIGPRVDILFFSNFCVVCCVKI